MLHTSIWAPLVLLSIISHVFISHLCAMKSSFIPLAQVFFSYITSIYSNVSLASLTLDVQCHQVSTPPFHSFLDQLLMKSGIYLLLPSLLSLLWELFNCFLSRLLLILCVVVLFAWNVCYCLNSPFCLVLEWQRINRDLPNSTLPYDCTHGQVLWIPVPFISLPFTGSLTKDWQ